jgi:hypothetical protein
MPHLEKMPTWFVKGDQRRAAYYTIQAREFRAEGYVEEGEKAAPAPQPKPQPEILVEAGQDAYDDDSIKEPVGERIEEMTKAELLDWAMDQGHDLKNALPKAEIFKACKEIESSL